MNDSQSPDPSREKHDKHHARKRRARRDAMRDTKKGDGNFQRRKRPSVAREDKSTLYIYGFHTVIEALRNPNRQKSTLFASANAIAKVQEELGTLPDCEIVERHPRDLDKLVGSDAVHQGLVLQVEPLDPKPFSEMGDYDLLLVLDQVTDPHNVGAIIRSAVALGAGAVITTSRYSPVETGVLAKSASGGLDLIDHIEVRNLAESLEELHTAGFTTVGLDSEESIPLEELPPQKRIALVLGAEGKGLRQKTRTTCNQLARIDMPGAIKSLNVSNAAALALYLSHQKLS